MKAYRVTALDRRDDSQLDSGLVVAEGFDAARGAALRHFNETWPGIPIELASVEPLKEQVILDPTAREGTRE